MKSDWTQRDIERLIKLFRQGMSGTEIAAAIHRSRGAVLGKIHRLREDGILPPATRKTKPKSEKPVDKAEPVPVRKPRASIIRPTPARPAEPPEPVTSRKVPILKAGPYHCRWIDLEPGRDGLATCCGHPVAEGPGLMFCEYHRAVARGDGTPSDRKALRVLAQEAKKDAA